MSESTPPTPTPSPDSPESPKKRKKRRTWKQRLKLTVLALLIAGLLARIALNYLLPTVVRKVANAYDLDCTYDRMSLSMLGGNAHIWNLQLRPKTGGDSIVRAEYIQGNLSTPNLFRGRLVVYRAEVDGVDMLVDREPDGSIPLLKRFLSPPADTPLEVKPKPVSATTQPVNLQSPLQIDAIRVSHVTTRFRDRSVTPTFETTIRTTVRVSDVGSADSPAKIELQISADPVMDALIVAGELRNTPSSIDADLSILLRGVHPRAAEAYLLPLGVRPVATDLTVKAQAKLSAATIPGTADVSASLAVSEISAVADTAEWGSLKSLHVDAKRLNASGVELGSLSVETGRLSARRSAAGVIQLAGFELVPVVGSHASAPPAAEAASAAPTPAAPFRVTLDELRLADLQASFDDQAVKPAGELIARLEAMSATNIVYDPDQPDAVVAFKGSASVPGVARTVTWKGTAVPFATATRAALDVRIDGIKPDALRPYLEIAGVQSELSAGTFTANLDATSSLDKDGSRSIGAKLANIRLVDAGRTLFDLGSVVVEGFSLDPRGNAVRLRSIDVVGPTLNVRREADGALAGLGLRLQPDAPLQKSAGPLVAVKAAPPATAPSASKAMTLPRVQIDRYAWKEIELNFEDRAGAGQPVTLRGSAGGEGQDLIFDPAGKVDAAKPGRFSAWLHAAGVAELLTIEGTLQATSRGAAFNADASGNGVTGAAVANYLKPLGVELLLKDGRFKARAAASIASGSDALTADLDLSGVSYADGVQELAGVDQLRITGFTLKRGGVGVEKVEIKKPRGQITRNADGTLQAGGIRLLPPPPSTQPAVQQPAIAGPPPPLKLQPASASVALKQLRIDDAMLKVTDRAATPPLETAMHGRVALDNVSLAKAEGPATIVIAGGIDGILDGAKIAGTLSLAPDAPAADLTIAADKIRADRVAAYLPPGVTSTFRDGHIEMAIKAAALNHADGGIAADVAVQNLVLEERADNATLAKVGSFTVRATRIDPAGAVYAIGEVSSSGVVLDVTQHPDGAIDALGLQLSDASRPSTAAASIPPATTPANPAPTSQPATDVAALVAEARRALPLLTVDKIDLNLDRLRINGLAGPGGKPVELARVRLHNTGAIELAGANAEQRRPVKLQIDGGIDPAVKQFAVTIEAAPFAAEPTVTVDLTATGVNGRGLTDVAPQLASTIHGDGLTNGTFKTQLVASLNYGRRGPRDTDIARGFTAMFTVKPLEFRGEPEGPVLLGLEEIRGEGIKVQPRAGNVAIKSIELVKPIGRFVRDEQGLHALGVVIPLKSAEPPVTQPVALAAESPVPPLAPTPSPQRPANELRLDRLMVSGIDVIFEDRTSTPPTMVPLKTLDLEVRDVSNQLRWNGKPIRFDMLCTSDKVPLPYRKGSTVAGEKTADGMEMRELFSQITASGRIGVKQADTGATVLTGWAKTSVNGFEMLGVRGLAEPYKITIGGGVFDDSNDIRFKDDGSIETRNKVVFTNLSLSEPADGPIQRVLKLPAPIDIAIGAVTDADGSITMNLPVSVESGTIETEKLVAPAIGAVANVLITAIASAPLKTVGGVGEMLGLGGKGGQAPEPPVQLAFLPGVATLESAESHQLVLLAERMRKDKNLELQLRHELSTADVAQAGRRANPPVEDVRAMTDRLRREKASLSAERQALAAQARTQFAAQSSAAASSVTALRSLDARLSRIDQSLDQLYDLLRPGAAGQADRRTRAASLDIASRRFDLVQSVLASAGVENVAERVRRTNPQFELADLPSGGSVIITLVPKKK
jgi:hypothetical protein